MSTPTTKLSFVPIVPFSTRIRYAHAPRSQTRRPRACATTHSIAEAQQVAASFHGTAAEGRRLAQQLLNGIPDVARTRGSPDEDGRAIAGLYTALQSSGALRAFGTAPLIDRDMTLSLDRLVREAGLPISALAPKKSTVLAWQVSGFAVVVAIVAVTRVLGMEELARPLLLLCGATLAVDQLALRGALFEGAYRKVFPQYAEKVLRHEAGHFLCAYLYGLPVRGVVLSAADAALAGFPGQAGTLFFDGYMAGEMRAGRVTQRTINRHSFVLMAGIAAEAIEFGEAEGGESDVQSLLALLTSLQPPWTAESVRAQARWAVLQAVTLLRENAEAFKELCEAMRQKKSLGDCVECIERLAVVKIPSAHRNTVG